MLRRSASSAAAHILRPALWFCSCWSRTIHASARLQASPSSSRSTEVKAAAPSSPSVSPPPREVTIPAPRAHVNDPKSFFQAISRGPRRALHDNTAALSALGDSWEDMWSKVLGGRPRPGGASTPSSHPSTDKALPRGARQAPGSPRVGKQINRDLRTGGVPVKDRRYILWALEKYRQGYDPAAFAIKPKPKKKIRGWGPRVQNGVRVRGRRRPGER